MVSTLFHHSLLSILLLTLLLRFPNYPRIFGLSTGSSTQILLWHQRLGHPSAKLLHLAIHSVNPKFTFNNVDVCCSSCKFYISAKIYKLPLNKHEIQSTSMLQIMHSNVWGPAPISSLFGYNYYVMFIDDFTCFTWFFLLKQNNEVFQAL